MTSSTKKNLVASSIGILGTEIVNHWFDILVYGVVMSFCQNKWGNALGALVGFLILTPLSFPLNYAILRTYRRAGVNQFFEWMEEQLDSENPTRIGKVLKFFLSKGYWPTVLLLCWEDPSKAFVFRRRKVSDKFSMTDWRVFIGTGIAGNAIHAALIGGVIAFIRALV